MIIYNRCTFQFHAISV